MRILLTNDDGINAPGIAAMMDALEPLYEVDLVAPAGERSGASHALTMLEPIRVESSAPNRWAVSGTPVDCVYLGLHTICTSPPDLVISGINKGANLGDDVFYSGTVGAAREAALNHIPSIAVSLDNQNWPAVDGRLHFESASAIVLCLIERMSADPLPKGTFVNLNVPNRPLEDIESVEVCGLGRRHYDPLVEERIDPRGRPYYWIGGEPVSGRMEQGTDGACLHRGSAALTPMGLDTTADSQLSQLTQWTFTQPLGHSK